MSALRKLLRLRKLGGLNDPREQRGLMTIQAAVVCGPGRLRSENQDNFFLNGSFNAAPERTELQTMEDRTNGQGLYAVADGMGGEQYGELSALIAVRALHTVDPHSGADGMTRYLLDRNAEICRMVQQRGGARSGSTFVSLSITGTSAVIVNIGDSRAYLLRNGQLRQISQDHTAAQQMVRLGVLTPEAARRHADRHCLTQHLGIFPDEMVIEPFTVAGETCPGDLFLLCSDGLYEMLEDSQLQELLKQRSSLREKTEILYEEACRAGGKDNITVLLASVGDEERT